MEVESRRGKLVRCPGENVRLGVMPAAGRRKHNARSAKIESDTGSLRQSRLATMPSHVRSIIAHRSRVQPQPQSWHRSVTCMSSSRTAC